MTCSIYTRLMQKQNWLAHVILHVMTVYDTRIKHIAIYFITSFYRFPFLFTFLLTVIVAIIIYFSRNLHSVFRIMSRTLRDNEICYIIVILTVTMCFCGI
jgi:hypothetical protein